MKTSRPDPNHINRIRLSDTQANGGLRISSRRPDADLHPFPLSESSLDEKTPSHLSSISLDSLAATSTPFHSSASISSTNNGGITQQQQQQPPPGIPSLTSHGGSSHDTSNANENGASASLSVSPAAASPAALPDAWPGSLLEGGPALPVVASTGDKKKADCSPPSNHSSDPAAGDVDVNDANGANGADDAEDGSGKKNVIANLAVRFVKVVKKILLHTWLNVFLVFVPVGIIVACIPSAPPAVVFSMNAIAIVPLAGLLGFATESVAHRMGDSIGALLNVTFGNAVELIIFIIALVKNELRIVQSSLLGSILANLLLILGMGFLLGGLRFREQIYNSTVTQMSACLLSLSVISLVLPTAFHASFSNTATADEESLKISRGTSVILLLVYFIYLLFQLKSHAYMYESTPQHIIDEEATPGPAAAWLDSSSSDDSSSSSSDSDSSGHSRDTMKKRMRRVIRARRRRKSSLASVDTTDGVLAGPTRTPSFGTATAGNDDIYPEETVSQPVLLHRLSALNISDEALDDDDNTHRRHKKRHYRHSLRRHRKSKKSSRADHDTATEDTIMEDSELTVQQENGNGLDSSGNRHTEALSANASSLAAANGETRRVDFAITSLPPSGADGMGGTATAAELASARRAFNLRAMSFRPVAKSLAPTVFTQPLDTPAAPAPTGPIPRVRYGIRRTNSLPDRLNSQLQFRPPGAMLPSQIPAAVVAAISKDKDADADENLMLSRKAAVLMLLVTTGLVAACAEFMVDSINGLVETGSVGEVFIGLIILPIVGNAAEHVTAVMVAMKNKMDLAIGVAVGSSIQIALFMTPLVVILGWIIDRDMTLYFTLFETVSLFVSAFMVNFLVLDGRSNYLEGALLLSTYLIIGLAAFFYPSGGETSVWGE